MKRSDMVKGLLVTAEVMGSDISAPAAEVMVRELEAYPQDKVVAALQRCRREVNGRLTLAAVIARIDDGHPGAEEAWAMCPRDEAQTVVWTDETCEAFGGVLDMIAADDWIGARMAFKERYTSLVREARDEKRPARWTVSLGHAASGRNGPINAAVAKGRLTADQAAPLLTPDTGAGNALPSGEGAPASLSALLGAGE